MLRMGWGNIDGDDHPVHVRLDRSPTLTRIILLVQPDIPRYPLMYLDS